VRERKVISDDITVVRSESGCLSIYSRMDDCSVQLDDEEARMFFEYLKQYLARNEDGSSS